MDMFLLLFSNLLPLYLLIGLGYIAGRFFDVERQTLGALGIYIFMPMVAFGFVGQMEFQPSYIFLPIALYLLLCALSFMWLAIGQRVFGDNRANLLALCASSGNTGYFGLPLVLTLFPPEWAAVYIFTMMGASVYEATVMVYLAARGKFDVRQSLLKLAKFPTLYAITAGVLFNLSGAEFSAQFLTYWAYFKGAYVVVGMMIIGAALSRVKKLVFGPRFLTLTYLGKFVISPLLALVIIMLDQMVFHLFGPEIHKLFFILAIVPTAANIAAFAVEMDLKPEKAATTILFGTFIALITIPFSLMLYDKIMLMMP